MNTAYINHKSDVDFPEETALYLAQRKLAGMHYQDAPVTTSKDEYTGSGSGTFDSFHDYATEPHVIGVRNNAHPMLKGGMMVGSVVPPREVSSHPTSPMGIIVTLSDRADIDDGNQARYDRIRRHTSNFGPDECDSVIADIPLSSGLTGDEIISQIENKPEMDPEVVDFLRQLHMIDEQDRTFTAFDETFEINKRGELDCITVLQVIRLNSDHTKWVWYRDYPLFASIEHRGTTNGWNAGSEQLLAAYIHAENRSSILDEDLRADHGLTDIDSIESTDLLSDDELETLCSEYLRQGLFKSEESVNIDPYERYTHTYPVGGSLQSVDIVAEDLATEQTILSQVTFESTADDKVNDLVSASGKHDTEAENIDAWFFGKDAAAAEASVDSDIVTPIEIQTVIETFNKSGNRSVLDAILEVEGNPSPPEILQRSSKW
jgi:hypothetical protein